MPIWLQIMLSLLPQIPQDAAKLAEIFAPHAGTPTGQKIVDTMNTLCPLVAAAATFDQQHATAPPPAKSP